MIHELKLVAIQKGTEIYVRLTAMGRGDEFNIRFSLLFEQPLIFSDQNYEVADFLSESLFKFYYLI
jgi:hypothetical protein